jgi:hypothetical protein
VEVSEFDNHVCAMAEQYTKTVTQNYKKINKKYNILSEVEVNTDNLSTMSLPWQNNT